MNKKITLLVIILFLIIVPIIVFATNNFVNYRNGKAVVIEGEEKTELEEGQKYTIAIESGKDTEEYNREEDLKKKREYEENMYSEDNIAKPSVEPYEVDDKELKEHNELKEKEQKILNLLYEYYSKDKIDELMENAEKYSNKSGRYEISKYQEELLDKLLTLIESKSISNEDKTMIIDILGQVDLKPLNNEKIEERLQNINIEVDK